MSKRIIGNLEIQGNLQTNGKYAMRFFNSNAPNQNTGDVAYPYFKKTEVNEILSMFPVSRVGTMDYLPLSVNGSYEGASSYSSVSNMQPILIEDDGTAVMLRAGTNGDTYGFYYSYIRNIRSITTLSEDDFITTGTEYRLSDWNSNSNIINFVGSNAYEILMYRVTNPTPGTSGYWITLTNGTMNTITHVSSPLQFGTLNSNTPLYASIVGDNIYIVCRDNSVSTGLAYEVYTVPVSSIGTGNLFPSRITGISGTNLRRSNYSSSTNIKLFDNLSSVGASTTSLFELYGSASSIEVGTYNYNNIQVIGNDDSTKIRIAIYPTYRVFSNITVSSVYCIGVSLVFDISAKSVTIDQSGTSPISITGTNSNNSTTFNIVGPFQQNITNINATNGSPLGNTGSMCQTRDGLLIANKSRWASEPTFGIQKATITPSNPYESLNLTQRTATNVSSVSVSPIFGSAVGENLLGVRFIDNRKILLSCAGTYDNINYGYNSTVYAEIGDTPTFVYNRLNSTSTINGYAPEIDRKFVSDSYDYSCLLSLVELDGTVKAYGTSFIEGIEKNSGGLLDSNTLDFDSNYTIKDSVLLSIKNKCITNSGISGITQSKIVLYYVPDSTFSKSFAFILGRTSSNVGYMMVSELDLVLSGTEITDGTVTNTISNNISSTVTDITTSSILKRFAGLTLAKYSGFTYMGIGSANNVITPGLSIYYICIAKIKNGLLSNKYRFMTNNYQQSGSGFDHGVIPGGDFGFYDYSYSDLNTKSVFVNCGTTEAVFDNFLDNVAITTTPVVVVAQQVAEGYIMYFTQEIPIFLGGMYYKIPIQSIDLSSVKADPSNSTFTLYIEMDRSSGIGSYVLSENLLDETLTRVFIGTIVTGTSGITSITTEKVTRFMTYRPSVFNRGSAIPCSSGVPSGPGTRW